MGLCPIPSVPLVIARGVGSERGLRSFFVIARIMAAMRLKETVAAVLAGFLFAASAWATACDTSCSLGGASACAAHDTATSPAPTEASAMGEHCEHAMAEMRSKNEPPAAMAHVPLAALAFRAVHSIGCAGDPCGKKIAWAGPETVRAARGSERFGRALLALAPPTLDAAALAVALRAADKFPPPKTVAHLPFLTILRI